MRAVEAIADPTRRRIVELLADGERSAGEIASQFQTSRPVSTSKARMTPETARTGVEVQNRELQARIISEQAAAYIWDKADEMGVALEVEVETWDLGSGPYPWRATLTGACGGEKRTALTQYIEENLAIPEARQVWQCE